MAPCVQAEVALRWAETSAGNAPAPKRLARSAAGATAHGAAARGRSVPAQTTPPGLPLLSIAGGDPHARLNLLEPATPGPHLQGRADARPWRADLCSAVPARLTGRRSGGLGTPPDLR